MYIPKMIRLGWSCLLWCLLLAAMPASAQFSPSDFASDPQHTAITHDRNNNIYTVAYDFNGRVTVLKYLNGSSSVYFVYAEQTAGPGVDGSFFSGIAVNSKDEVFLTTSLNDVGGSRILKVRFNGTGYDPAQLVRSGEGYSNLAFDQQDNLLVLQTDVGTGKCKLVKYLAGQETGAGIVLCDDSNVPGLFRQKDFSIYPWGLAVDKNNTVYFTTCLGAPYNTPNSNQIFRLKQGETTPTPIGSGGFTSLACDDNGNLYALEADMTLNGTFGRVRFGASGSQPNSMLYGGVFSDVVNGYIPLGITVTGNNSAIYFDQLTDYNNNPLTAGVKKLTPLSLIVTELSAVNPTVTNANTVRYKFNTNLGLRYTPGIDAFSLNTAGLTGAAITNVLPNVNYYTIDVNTGTGDGTLTLALKNGGLINPVSNAPYTGATYTIDKTPPVASILSTPPAMTSAKNATFAFTANETATYETRLDGGAPIAGTSPLFYTGLSTGAHLFEVRATDNAGNQSAWVPYNWTITTNPSITSVTVPAAKYYNATEALVFDVAFDQDVMVNTASGIPYIDLTIGSQVRQAKYISSPGPNTLRFSYQLQMGDDDADGIAVNNLNLNGATIQNAGGNNANTTLNNIGNTSSVKVNTTMPSCVISMSAPSPVNGDFVLTAVYSEAVTGVNAGTVNVVYATVTYLGGTGTTYTFKISPTREGAFNMSMSTMGVRQALAGNLVLPSNTINFVVDKTAPKVSSVAVPGNKYYREGDVLDFDVTFDENIVVNTAGGTPLLQLTIGSATKQAVFLSSPSPNVARFRYIIANGDMDNDGITINSLSVNGGSIRDAATNNAVLTLNSIGNTAGILVNTAHPTAAITTAAPAYVKDAFTATITFSEVVSLFKPANITVTNAVLSNMVTSDSITFTVTVTLPGDGPVAIQVPADAALNIGGNGNQASNTLSVTADKTAPAVAAVSVAAGYYKIGSNLDVDVAFNERLTMSTAGGTPYINITIGSQVRQAVYVSSPSSSSLRFRYTVVPQDETVTGITVNTLNLNGSVIRDQAGNDANITLNNIGSTSGVKVNTMLPTCVLSMASPIVNGAFTLTLTFSEPVTGLSLSSLTIANADLSNLAMVNATTYTLMITPRTPGAYTMYLPAGAVKQALAGNDNQESNKLTFNVDQTAPEVSSVAVPPNGYHSTGDPLEFKVTMSETTVITGTPSLPITIGTKTVQADYTSDNGREFFFSYVVKAGDNDLDGITVGGGINLNGGTLKDVAGNNALLALNSVGNTSQVLVYTAVPTATLTTSAVPVVGPAFTMTVTFSEKVTGLVEGDFTVSNATVDPPITTDGGRTYTMLVKPIADGAVAVTLPANSAVNIAGIGNAASNTLTATADVTAPQVTSVAVPVNDYYAAGQTLDFEVRFSEPVTVTGTPFLSLTIGSKVVQVPYTGTASGNGLAFAYQVQPGERDDDGVELGTAVQLNGGTIKDPAGNDAALTLSTISPTTHVRVNTAIPGVTLNPTVPSPVNKFFGITVSFSEVVTGLTIGDFQVTNGRVDSLTDKNGAVYTVWITPVVDGPVQVTLPANTASNNAHTGNSISNTVTVTYDATAPQVNNITAPLPGSYKAGQSLDFLVNMSEEVWVSGIPSIPVIIGSRIVQATFDGKGGPQSMRFKYIVQAGDVDLDGISVGAVMHLNGGTINDAAGNNAELTLRNIGNTSQVLVTAQQPTVTLSTIATSPVSNAFTVKFVFSEAVTGFTISDITVGKGTAGQLQTTDNITYTAVITPSDGAVTIQVPAGVARNSVGNDNLASNTLTLQGDVTAPVVTSVDVPAPGYYKAGQQLNFKLTLSEPVTAATTSYIPVTIGTQTVQATYTGGTGTATLEFSYTIPNGAMDMDGITVGAAFSGVVKDQAGNNAVTTLNNVGNTSNVFVNTQHPTVIVSTTAVSPVRQAFPVTVTFSEAVTGLATGGITVTNGTLSPLQTTNNIAYTTMVTPSADGTVTVKVAAGAAQNIGLNDNDASNTLSLQADITAPVVTSTGVPVNGHYKAGKPLEFNVTMSELVNVTGTPSIPVTIGTQTVQATYTGGTGTATLQFSYTVQNGDNAPNGISLGNAIVLNGGSLKDAAGNDAVLTLQAVPATNGIVVKTTSPAVTLSSSGSGRINTPFTVKLSFSDVVTGLTAAAIQVTNGSAGTLQTTDNIHYTALITPAADGNVAVQLPAGIAADIAGNTNQASNQLSLVYDATAPVVGPQTFDVLDNSPAGTSVGQLTATDALGTVQGWTLTTDGSGGALSLDANGRITVKDNTALRTFAGKTISLQVTVSDGLNTSTAVPVTVRVQISYVNKQPVMDRVADVYMCATTATQTIQLTGVSPVEPDQHYTITLAADQPYFDLLKADVVTNTIRYQLKPGVTSGNTAITLTMKDDGGTDNGGKDTYSQTFYLTVNPLPGVSISSDKGATVSKGDIVTLTATGGVMYTWEPASGTSGDLHQPTLTVRPHVDATYQVTGTNAAGCSAVATISIRVADDYKLDATNLLTPNGDGKNDRWVVRNLDSYPDNEVKIFDRTGRLIYQRRNYSNDWDGTLNGHPLAEGTYYYVLTVNGTSRVWKGFITIIRNDQ
ncbi:Ig-like domain-containing protein [Chitinophaga varians]|uniref:Ig-like domain-containing protein n=1 Tax=Chitinophaga varians TaxID=2202339 RepID=UPI00165F0C49|nr:Ig-like domain-containing protein [Chitinophaga varians]MBC9914622.1 gliding motility-associated C-terminal domain-containing protein [Chitinophaga varians]